MSRAVQLGLVVTAAVFGAGVLVAMAHAPALAAAMVAAAVTAAAVLATVFTMRSAPAAWWQSACGAAAAGWLAYASVAGPWSWQAGLGLLVPAAALTLTWPQVRAYEERVAEAQQRQRAEAERVAGKQKWPALLARIGHEGVSFVSRQDTLCGYSVVLWLPPTGRVTYSQLAASREKLEVAARARHGSLRFERGHAAHEVILHVAEQDVLAQTIPLPIEQASLTITRPIPVGVYEDGQICALTLREVATLIVGLRGSGKALALDTPVPVPDGWTTMGELKAGDLVYDETGTPCTVTDAWEVRQGRPCYEIEFSDGSRIVADGEHQWRVDTVLSRRSESNARRHPRTGAGTDQRHKMYQPQVRTTEDMIGSLRFRTGTTGTADGCEVNYSIPVTSPLKSDDRDLPVPPYTLGAWLGDGASATGSITTADHEILSEIEDEGERVWIVPSTIRGAEKPERAERACLLTGPSCSPAGKPVARGLCINHWNVERRAGRLDKWPLSRRQDTERRERLASYCVDGLKVRLRAVGVLGNKHIPDSYLRASEAQRRTLLAGLLDTDGTCTKYGGVEFCSAKERLARDVHHLVATLGYKPTLRSKTVHLNGKDCGLAWTVSFTTADKVFRLPRKASRQVTSERATQGRRYITAIRPVPSVPVRCIAVDSPSHLYLVGESCIPTHNSNLLNVLIAQLARCVDVLIFVIDQKGGRVAKPWLEPWLAGTTPNPVIDWVATTREEAEIMLRACLRGIDARSRSGSGGEKIIPSARQPAIMLIVDEAAVIFGMGTGGPRSSLEGVTNSQLAALGTQITMLGRSEAIDPVFATQRGTVTMTGSGDLKSQCGLRIGLGVASEADARLIIPDDVRIAADLAALAHPGSGIVQVKQGRVTPVKFFRLEHEQIAPIAERTGWIRPGPDKVLEDALGQDYAHRWHAERAGHLPRVSAGGRPMVRAAIGVAGTTDAAFQAIIAGSGLAGLGHEAEDAARRRMREFIRRHGDRGATPAMIRHLLDAESTAVPLQTIHRWLAEDELAGLVEPGTLGRWRSTGKV